MHLNELEHLATRSFAADIRKNLTTLLMLGVAHLLKKHLLLPSETQPLKSALALVTQSFPMVFPGGDIPGVRNPDALKELTDRISTSDDHSLLLLLAELYERLIDPRTARSQGSFYTPASMAIQMTRQSLSSLSCATPQVADIACGSGIFLLTTLNHLSETTNAINALRSVYGIDQDPGAVRCCQMLLQLWALVAGVPLSQSAPVVRGQIQCGNALLDRDRLPQSSTCCTDTLRPLSIKTLFPQVFKHRAGFDLIIGNPPFGLSRNQRIDEEQTRLLKHLYRSRIQGRINTSLLFILRAWDLLANGGMLSLIVPNAWLGIDEALSLRKMLVEQHALRSINSFIQSPFGSLGVEVVTVTAQRGNAQNSFTIQQFESASDSIPRSSTELTCSQIREDPSYRIPLATSSAEQAVLRQIEYGSTALGKSTMRASIALQAYARGKGTPAQTAETVRTHPFHLNHPTGTECIPYLEGRDVSRLSIAWSGRWLRYGPWLAEHHDIRRYTGPRILVREILAPSPRLIQAAYTEAPYTYNRSVLHIHEQEVHQPGLLEGLALLLNSTLAGFWLRHRGRKAQRSLFPKLLARDLNEFPLPADFKIQLPRLARLYGKYAAQNLPHESLLNQLDHDICLLYNISPEQRISLPVSSDSQKCPVLVLSHECHDGTKNHDHASHKTAQEVPFLEQNASANN